MIPGKCSRALNFFNSNRGSQFWNNLNNMKSLFELATKFSLGHGHNILFRSDRWIGESALSTRFMWPFYIFIARYIYMFAKRIREMDVLSHSRIFLASGT
jgi:hypothetical protein